MPLRTPVVYHWKAAPGRKRYHAVGDGKNRAVCGLLQSWNRTAYAVDATNTCPKCWKVLDPVPQKP